MGKNVRACMNCGGHGKVMVETKPGKWEEKKCPACNGRGKVVISTI